jgi:hypothetical protein
MQTHLVFALVGFGAQLVAGVNPATASAPAHVL